MRANFVSTAWKGGSGWFVHELAGALVRNGVDLTLIAPPAEPAAREAALPPSRRLATPRGADGRGGRIGKVRKSLVKIASGVLASARARQTSPVFLYTHMDWLAAGVLHFLVLRLLGARLIYIVHDATPHAAALPARLRWLERGLLTLSYRLPARLVALTDAARWELIERYGIRPRKITVIPHGAYAPAETSPLPGEGRVLLFGMLRQNKRIAEAIQAFVLHGARFPALRLVIAGAPHKEDYDYWRRCETLIQGAPERIDTEIGFVEEARVGELMRAADAVLLAYEDFNSQSGVAVLSCFSERPIVGTRAGGLAELESRGLEMIPIDRPVSSETIADALEALSAMPAEQLRQKAARSCAALAGYLSWDRIALDYAGLIHTLYSR